MAARSERLRRLPLNVEGPFYTTGDCTSCGAPEHEALDLLAPLDDDNQETYFVRQPRTPEEIERACNAIRVCCASGLRYGGQDRTIIGRLGNTAERSDYVVNERDELIDVDTLGFFSGSKRRRARLSTVALIAVLVSLLVRWLSSL